MHSLYFTTLSLLLLEATAWPTMQLLERDSNNTSSSNMSSGDASSDDLHDLAMKAFAFNLGYTALSVNSSCSGEFYPNIVAIWY